MKKYSFKFITALIAPILILSACNNTWEDHYATQSLSSNDQIQVFKGKVEEYLRSTPEFSTQHKLFVQAGIYDKMLPRQEYTILLYPDNIMANSVYASDSTYAAYCISDFALAPAQMTEGLGIHTWYGKNIWIRMHNGQPLINDCPIAEVIRTQDAYIYRIDEKLIPVNLSVYEVINNLDEAQYSKFKALIRLFEQTYFDPDKCTPAGTNEQGNTIYADSVKGWTTRNVLMDRYTVEGQDFWNMRNETYNSTVFIPSNAVLEAAIDTALARIPLWLRRNATAADRSKFEKWLVQACFVDRSLEAEEVRGKEDIDCVGGYLKDSLENTRFRQSDNVMWRPTVQIVRTDDVISASNGKLYFVDWMKIPNNVIIYRLKSRFYELWNNMNQEQRNHYFRWDHWIDPMVLNDAQGSFQLSETLPTMYYHVLTAIPDKDARRDSLVCSLTFDGVLFNQNNPRNQQIQECFIPAGEYYLRMGFKHSLLYSLSIQFCDTLLVKDMVMYAQGSNFHFDRGSVSVVDNYGESSIGYPEGYNWHDWSSLSDKAQAYDTDGYPVAIVNMKQDGNFTITISSSDMSYLYTYGADRNTHNVSQLMMYHWCLRPTKNNY